ncbi:MAG: hypothetical protein ACLTZU_11135 [Odoribacter splanchnicus]
MKVLLSIVFLFASLATFSQAVINFSNRAHDFGTIKEVNGAVFYDFEFVNADCPDIDQKCRIFVWLYFSAVE